MFDSIEDAISSWKDDYSFIEDATLVDYRGGYPVVEFIIKEAAWDLVKDEKMFKRIVRNSEMEGGIEVGVATCFYDTASLSWKPPVMTICGYPEVIQRIIKKVF